MSLSFAGGHRSPSASHSTGPGLANPVSGVIAHPSEMPPTGITPNRLAPSGLTSSPVVAGSPAPAPPVLATPAVSPIVQAVERRLRESSYYYLRSIRCGYEAGVITLRGRVPTFYLKQTVQSIVEKIEGVEQVVNLVEVFDSRQDTSPAVRRTA
jgi:BON domain